MDDMLLARVELEFAARLRDMLFEAARSLTLGTTEAGELKARIRALIEDYHLADKKFRTRFGTELAVRDGWQKVYSERL